MPFSLNFDNFISIAGVKQSYTVSQLKQLCAIDFSQAQTDIYASIDAQILKMDQLPAGTLDMIMNIVNIVERLALERRITELEM